MSARYFVMIAGRPKQTGSRIMLVFAFTPVEAHEYALKEYRAAEGLASSVHVLTERVYVADTEAEAHEFIDRLAAAMDAKASANGGGQAS